MSDVAVVSTVGAGASVVVSWYNVVSSSGAMSLIDGRVMA